MGGEQAVRHAAVPGHAQVKERGESDLLALGHVYHSEQPPLHGLVEAEEPTIDSCDAFSEEKSDCAEQFDNYETAGTAA